MKALTLPISQIIEEYEIKKVPLNRLGRTYSASPQIIKNRLIQAGIILRTKRECYDLYGEEVTKQGQKEKEKPIQTVSLSSKRRFPILARDGFRCQYCGRSAQDGVELVVEHIIAKRQGGTDAPLNLITACKRCNNSKGSASLITSTGQIPSFILLTTRQNLSHKVDKR